MNVAALDIGGTKILGGIIDESGMIVYQNQIPTQARYGAERIESNIYKMIDELLYKYRDVKALGIDTTGRVNIEKGSIKYATKMMPGWTGFDLKGKIKKRYGLPTAVENDVKAMAKGEGWIGAGRQFNTYVCLALGTGVGGAYVEKGAIFHGSHWDGAELGHIILHAGGRQCLCGMKGCAEQYISGTAVYQRYNELSGKSINSAMEVIEQLKTDDEFAIICIDEFAQDLAYTILSLNNTFDPQGFIIGGGLIGSFDYWWNKLISKVEETRKDLVIVPAELGGRAGMIGAARLAFDIIK